MANPNKRGPANAPGDFFVDSTCIDCDPCRQIAPQVLGEATDTSFVRVQPDSPDDRRLAEYRFEWVLPGHGQRAHLPAEQMRAEVLRLADAMRSGGGGRASPGRLGILLVQFLLRAYTGCRRK